MSIVIIKVWNNGYIADKVLPNERKQCEFIWKPVYEEYRRIGYRLKPYKQFNLFNGDCIEIINSKEKD